MAFLDQRVFFCADDFIFYVFAHTFETFKSLKVPFRKPDRFFLDGLNPFWAEFYLCCLPGSQSLDCFRNP